MSTRSALVAALLLATWAGGLRAQGPHLGSMPVGEVTPDSARHRPQTVRVAKWLVLGVALASATYGYRSNRLADSRFEELDRLCQQEPVSCLHRTPSGAYADPAMEARYQDVRRLDRHATIGLVSAEVAFAGAVGLFLWDLRNARSEPPNIPYSPPKLSLGVDPLGRATLRVRLAR